MITIHDRLMMYKGNFKSTPKKKVRINNNLKKTSIDAKNEPALIKSDVENSLETIFGTVGCATGVKALRCCFKSLLDDYTDSRFTGRLMKIVKEIYHRDLEGKTGKKSIFFSREKYLLATVVFNIREKTVHTLSHQFEHSHNESRNKATLALTEFRISYALIPKGTTHFRIFNHLSIISDYTYSDINQRFEPLSQLNTINAIVFSKFIPVGVPLTDQIEVSLPVNEDLPEQVSVIQCVGVVFYTKSGLEDYIISSHSSVMVCEVF